MPDPCTCKVVGCLCRREVIPMGSPGNPCPKCGSIVNDETETACVECGQRFVEKGVCSKCKRGEHAESNANSCGRVCFPASQPGDGCPPFDCTHDVNSHYSIDGEAVGCTECEEAEDERHAVKPCCPAFPDCLHPIPRGDRQAIEDALVAPLFPKEEK